LNASHLDIFEDFLEYLVLNEAALSPTLDQKSDELQEWEQEVWNDPSKFEDWAQKQAEKIQQVNKQI